MRTYKRDYARKWKLGMTCPNVLVLFGMVKTAWASIVLEANTSQNAGETVLMRVKQYARCSLC